MITATEIEQFYRDFEALGLVKPNAALVAATGESKANVSRYLNRLKTPSENFIKKFYEKFPKPPEPPKNGTVLQPGKLEITVEDYIDLLKSQLEDYRNVVKLSLDSIHAKLQGQSVTNLAFHQTTIVSLAELRHKKATELFEDVDKRIGVLMEQSVERDTLAADAGK